MVDGYAMQPVRPTAPAEVRAALANRLFWECDAWCLYDWSHKRAEDSDPCSDASADYQSPRGRSRSRSH
eukprot:gene17336-7212_t